MTETNDSLPNSSLTPAADLPTETRLGHVHLNVNDLERQIGFYTQVLGFTLLEREGTEAALGTSESVLLRLSEDRSARRAQYTAGMYHFAVLYPSLKELARAIARLMKLRWPNAPTDHGVSMTTYLDDAEGNNIELYVRTLERATFETANGQMFVRYADGRSGSGRDALDLEALFAELEEGERLDAPLPEGTQIGHMHLYASGLESSMAFYHGVLGFEEGPVIPGFRMGEVGLDARQPHVIAFNTWKGEGIAPAAQGALGLRHFTIVLPDAAELSAAIGRVEAAGIALEQTAEGVLVRDPSGIGVILSV